MAMFGKPKKYLMKVLFNIGTFNFCYVDIEPENYSEELLVNCYISFLKRYFYIVDKRQKDPMKKILIGYLTGNKDFPIMYETEKMIYETLNEKERKALNNYINSDMPLPALLSDEPVVDIKSKYEFYYLDDKHALGNKFYMKIGADKIILSRLVALFFEYVDKKVKKEDRKNIYNFLINL